MWEVQKSAKFCIQLRIYSAVVRTVADAEKPLHPSVESSQGGILLK